jgi:excisionase family DNA binding protein
MPVLDSPKFLNNDQAAEYLGIRPQTLKMWRCLKRQAIPFTRIGSRMIRYRKHDLDAWLSAREVSAADAVSIEA